MCCSKGCPLGRGGQLPGVTTPHEGSPHPGLHWPHPYSPVERQAAPSPIFQAGIATTSTAIIPAIPGMEGRCQRRCWARGATTAQVGATGGVASACGPTTATIIRRSTIGPISFRRPGCGYHYVRDDVGKNLFVAIANRGDCKPHRRQPLRPVPTAHAGPAAGAGIVLCRFVYNPVRDHAAARTGSFLTRVRDT